MLQALGWGSQGKPYTTGDLARSTATYLTGVATGAVGTLGVVAIAAPGYILEKAFEVLSNPDICRPYEDWSPIVMCDKDNLAGNLSLKINGQNPQKEGGIELGIGSACALVVMGGFIGNWAYSKYQGWTGQYYQIV